MSNNDLPVVYLEPGNIYMGNKKAIVKTILGSCVAITMFNQKLQTGIICHILLPSCKHEIYCKTQCENQFKYLNCTAKKMLDIFQKIPVEPRDIEVKMFGGADVLPTTAKISTITTVGKQNIEAANKIIKDNHLRLLARDVGGISGRKVLFFPHTGEILLRRVKNITR